MVQLPTECQVKRLRDKRWERCSRPVVAMTVQYDANRSADTAFFVCDECSSSTSIAIAGKPATEVEELARQGEFELNL